MPLPTPSKGESKKDFLSRCMSNDTMKSEYPKTKQRYAVCNSKWNRRIKDWEENDRNIRT